MSANLMFTYRNIWFLLFSVLFLICISFPALTENSPALIIEHGPKNIPKIALTFDACPTGTADEYDEQVVNVLLKEKVPATLFLSGRWIEKNIEKTKFLASQPLFEIANHSYYHPHLMEKPDDRVRRELVRTQAIIKQETGKYARYFRPPFGEVNEHVAQLAKEAGLITIQYDIASGDPDSALSAARISKAILENAGNGSIIVFHMNRKGVHTAELLPDVIHGLTQKGFTLVTIGELLNEKGIHQGMTEKSIQTPSLPEAVDKEQASSPPVSRP